MTGSMTWDEGGAGEASGQVASMADAVQAQSRRLAGITVNQGDATGMIRELLHTWATELDLRGEAVDVWPQPSGRRPRRWLGPTTECGWRDDDLDR